MGVEDFTKDEQSLLLYLETRAVDYGGRMNGQQLNNVDRENLTKWKVSGYVESGRICADDHNKDGTLWCKLSERAFNDATALRKARMLRMWENRHYRTTAEKALE